MTKYKTRLWELILVKSIKKYLINIIKINNLIKRTSNIKVNLIFCNNFLCKMDI